jgi:hypothetical protein
MSGSPAARGLQQAVVFTVGAPAFELLQGHGKHADARGDEAGAFNQEAHHVGVPGRPDEHHQGNAVPKDPEPGQGADE